MKGKSQPHNNKNDEVHKWIKNVQNNPLDMVSYEKIVVHYQGLVDSLARKYSKSYLIHEDLVQVGMLGLLAAVKRFDLTIGKSFEAFLIPTIIGEMKRYIRDKTWSVHVPRRIKELGPKIKKAADYLTMENQASPTIKQIADYLEVSQEEILETLEMGRSYTALSIDRRIEANADGNTVLILDMIGMHDHGYDEADLKILLEKIIPVLTEREQQIINYTFFENLSQKEAGKQLGISQMHVSRLQRRSLEKLRKALQINIFEIFNGKG